MLVEFHFSRRPLHLQNTNTSRSIDYKTLNRQNARRQDIGKMIEIIFFSSRSGKNYFVLTGARPLFNVLPYCCDVWAAVVWCVERNKQEARAKSRSHSLYLEPLFLSLAPSVSAYQLHVSVSLPPAGHLNSRLFLYRQHDSPQRHSLSRPRQ